ncbi:Hypothetical predicted protein [Mytilus galloprovincialis]|uniref:Uncharacterized protein n=1 Tax=Mytilus galloprovincialis TaxID=29158 RepID=A0A8B6GDR3_MYTGA|nr:Hypothetical predicted protein [Mytilus galloprovincialis]
MADLWSAKILPDIGKCFQKLHIDINTLKWRKLKRKQKQIDEEGIFPSFPTPYMPQLTDLSQPIDFSQSGHDRYQPRPVEDWLSNVYYQNTTATLPHSMYHYRYNPYQMYDYSSYAQNFHHQYTTPHQPQPLTMTHTSPAASITYQLCGSSHTRSASSHCKLRLDETNQQLWFQR